MPQALTLVLLPGRACNNLLWQKILPYLPEWVHPVMPNLLECETVEEMLEKIAKVPDSQFALLGFSMGGYLAQAFYAKYPERVSHLVLLGCSNLEHHPSAEDKASRLELIQAYLENPHLITSGKYLDKFVHAGGAHSIEAKEICLQMVREVGVETICRQMRATIERPSYTAALEQCEIPRLVIAARYDKLTLPEKVASLTRALRIEPHWLDCGHMTPLEAPEEVGTILRRWFENVRSN